MTTATVARPTTGTLRMIRGEIDMREFHRWMGGRRFQDADHAMHCLLVECFGHTMQVPRGAGPDGEAEEVMAVKPFRLMVPRDNRGPGCLYAYTGLNVEELRERMGMCGCPLQERMLDSKRLDDKVMPSEWREGLRLGFEVRVRPVIRLPRNKEKLPPDMTPRFPARSSDEDNLRLGAEVDAFQWEALQYPKGEMDRSREAVYREWLGNQVAQLKGAEIDAEKTTLVSFQRTRAVRKLRRGQVEGPDAVMRGVLTVTDSEAFTALLTHGIGRHRAYGYGMLLLRQASG